MLAAALARFAPTVDAARDALLDEYEASGSTDLRQLAGALVRPPAALLTDEGGRAYLQIQAQLIARVHADPGAFAHYEASIVRWRDVVGAHLDTDATRLHRRFTAVEYAAVELGRRARAHPTRSPAGSTRNPPGARRRRDDRLFVSHVVDVVTAILGAPVSAETRRLMKERDAATTVPRRSRTRGGTR